MNDLQMWSLLVGALAPPFIAVVQQPRWSPQLRTLVMVVTCVGLGVGNVWFSGQVNPSRLVSSILLVGLAAVGAYRTVWKPSTITDKIEQATSLTKKDPLPNLS